MDAVQAAILRVKLGHLDAWNEARRAHAAAYDAALAGTGLRPHAPSPEVRHARHIYVVRSGGRDALRQSLRQAGIESRVHYPVPLHLLDAWRALGHRAGSYPHAERAAREVVSIPSTPSSSRTRSNALRQRSVRWPGDVDASPAEWLRRHERAPPIAGRSTRHDHRWRGPDRLAPRRPARRPGRAGNRRLRRLEPWHASAISMRPAPRGA
jgi:hypothetical protein